MAKKKRILLSREEVDKLLEPGESVHTYRQVHPDQVGPGQIVPALMLIGSVQDRHKLLDLAENGEAELAGELATTMKHGIAIWDGAEPIFCATA